MKISLALVIAGTLTGCVVDEGDVDVAEDESELAWAPSQPAPCPVPNDNSLVAWLRFNGNASDASGGCERGTVSGPVLHPGHDNTPSSAYSFDGVDDKITIDHEVSFDSQAFTIAMWIKPMVLPGSGTSGCFHGELVNKAADNYGPFSVSLKRCAPASFGDIVISQSVEGGTSSVVAASARLYVGEWRHVTVTNDGSGVHIYIDGFHAVGAYVPSVVPNNHPVVIGAGPISMTNMNRRRFNGVIDEFRFYNYALSSADVARLTTL